MCKIDIGKDFGSLKDLGWEAIFEGPDVYTYKNGDRYVEIDNGYVDIHSWNGESQTYGPAWLTTLELKTLCKFCCYNNLIKEKEEK